MNVLLREYGGGGAIRFFFFGDIWTRAGVLMGEVWASWWNVVVFEGDVIVARRMAVGDGEGEELRDEPGYGEACSSDGWI